MKPDLILIVGDAVLEMKAEFFMTLAGHMHGGQIYVPGFGALVMPGTARFDLSDMRLPLFLF